VEKGQFVKAEPAFTPPPKKKKIVYRVFKLSTGEELFSVKKQTFLKYFEIWNNGIFCTTTQQNRTDTRRGDVFQELFPVLQ
jgi:hypothetical protein